MSSRLIFLILTVVVLGCSPQKYAVKKDDASASFGSAAEARKALEGDQVRCEGDCPDYVGAFYLYHSPVQNGNIVSHQLKLCSATLISPQRVLTNRHCLEDVMKEGDLCDDKVFIEIKFPQTSGKSFRSVKCKKILKTSEDYMNQQGERRRFAPDWAVVELASAITDREPVAQVPGGSQDRAGVDLYPVFFDFSYNPILGVIKHVQCRQSFQNPSRLFALDEFSPLFYLENCSSRLIKGNSGSGVFSSQARQLIGVMALAENDTAAGTMAHCLPDFQAGGTGCFFSEDQMYTDILKTSVYLSHYLRDSIQSAAGTLPMSEESSWRWSERALESADLRRFEMTFSSPWKEQVDYLERTGNRQLLQKIKLAFAQLFFLRAPECARANPEGASVEMPLGTLENWNFLSQYVWNEITALDGSGQEYNTIESRFPGNRLRVTGVHFKVTSAQQTATFEIISELPSPLASLRFQLPMCR